MAKKKWLGQHTFIVGTSKPVVFIGRDPVFVENEQHRKDLVRFTGVIEELPGFYVRYVGKATLKKKDGSKYVIDADGYCDYDKKELPDTSAAEVDKNFQEVQ